MGETKPEWLPNHSLCAARTSKELRCACQPQGPWALGRATSSSKAMASVSLGVRIAALIKRRRICVLLQRDVKKPKRILTILSGVGAVQERSCPALDLALAPIAPRSRCVTG